MAFVNYKDRFLFSFFVLSLVFGACRKEELPVKPEPSPFSVTVENNATTFPAAGGTANLVVNGGTNGWWVTAPTNNWCVVSKTYGSGDFKIPVTIKPNTTGAQREITVTVHPTFNLPAVAIKLVQSN